jgi:hypothetical protein
MPRLKTLPWGIILTLILTACSEKKQPQESDKMDSSSQRKMSTMKSNTSGRHDRNSSLESSLETLPRILSSDQKINLGVLRELGIPAAQTTHISQALRRGYEAARAVRRETTRSLSYQLGKQVEIPPLSGSRIEAIVDQVRDEIGTSDEGVSGVAEIGLLFKHQLDREFGRPLLVTLKESENLALSHYTQTPVEYRGKEFEVKRTKGDGSTETFTVDPVQNENSEFFYLNLNR